MKNESNKSDPLKVKRKFKRTPRPIRWFREVLAIGTWSVAFLQLFVFDFIGYVTSILEIPALLSTYRALFILATLIVLWTVLGNQRFIRFVGYIFTYPFVIFLWHFPRIFFRNWQLFIAFSPAIHSVITSFRSIFIIYGSGLIAAFVVLFAPQTWAIGIGMALLGLVLTTHFLRQIKTAFAATTVFSMTADAIAAMWEKAKTSDLFVPPTDVDPSTDEGKVKFGTSLISSYAVTAGLGMVANKMREIADSRRLDFYLILSWSMTVVLTVLVFALLYFGLARIEPGSFSTEPSFWDSIGYSICVLTTSSLSTITPLTQFAKILSFTELLGTFSVMLLMVFLILTSLRDKYRSDLERIAKELTETSLDFEKLLATNYDLTIHAAEQWLLKYNLQIAKLLLRLRHEKRAIEEFETEIKKAIHEVTEVEQESGHGPLALAESNPKSED